MGERCEFRGRRIVYYVQQPMSGMRSATHTPCVGMGLLGLGLFPNLLVAPPMVNYFMLGHGVPPDDLMQF